jgi:two-component sensor histidine kinase
LPFRWDHEFPGLGGTATYRIDCPGAVPGGAPAALLMSGVGNQVSISFNDALVASYGTLGDPGHDASKSNLLVPLAAALHREGQAQSLVVRTTVQRQRGAGLASIQYGSEASLAAQYRTQQNWRNTSAIVYAVSLLLMGGLAGGLWLRQRDALYGCFALAALSGVARNLDRVWPDVPIPWPLLGRRGGGLLCLPHRAHRALRAAGAQSQPAVAGALHSCGAGAVGHAGLRLLRVRAACAVDRRPGHPAGDQHRVPALRGPRRAGGAPAHRGVLMAAGTGAILAGAHDLLLVRMGLFGGAYYTLTAHAMFFFVMILAGLVVERYSRTVADYSALNANLAARVAEREEQLRGAFETVRQQQQEQAVLLERQRIMREIHDGVGSQLVGLLNVVTQPAPDRGVVEEHVKLALDEMRMAVDSLQPTHDDLPTVLATLRYRLQPRLDAAGIELVWDVAVMPTLAPFAAQAALQLQRILLEAFTNVLKHARATRIVMQAGWHGEATPPLVRIVLTDNGRAFLRLPRMAGPRAMALRTCARAPSPSARGCPSRTHKKRVAARACGWTGPAPCPEATALRRQRSANASVTAPSASSPRPAMKTISPQASSRAPDAACAHRDERQQRAGQEDQRVDGQQPVDQQAHVVARPEVADGHHGHAHADHRGRRGAQPMRTGTKILSSPRWISSATDLFGLGHHLAHLLHALRRRAVDGQQHVAGLHAGLRRGPAASSISRPVSTPASRFSCGCSGRSARPSLPWPRRASAFATCAACRSASPSLACSSWRSPWRHTSSVTFLPGACWPITAGRSPEDTMAGR